MSDIVATTKVNDSAQATTKIRRALICSLVMRSGLRGGGNLMGICLPVFESCQRWQCQQLLTFRRATLCFLCVLLGSLRAHGRHKQQVLTPAKALQTRHAKSCWTHILNKQDCRLRTASGASACAAVNHSSCNNYDRASSKSLCSNDSD